MSNTPRQPRPDDAVLGGQYQAPVDGAVLGGIEGLRQRLATDNLEVKKVALTQALNYGEKGVKLLFEVLDKDKNLDVYWSAYQLLESSSKKNLSWWDKLQGKKDDDSFSESLKQHIRKQLKNHFPCYEFESVTVNHRGEIIQRTPGKARYFREDLGNGIHLDMTYIPGGSFMMGAPESEKDSCGERPQHQVSVPSFWMGKYTITQEQYQAVMGNNRSRFKDNPHHPADYICWEEAQAFCQKLKEMSGKDFCLPTEAEWEYACRAGTTTPFYCGETISIHLANHYGHYIIYGQGKKGVDRETTTPVGSFPANPWGLYDMAGNVWEWCADSWHDNYRDKPDSIRNNGSIIWSGGYLWRVLRGGSWFSSPWYCRSANRLRFNPDFNFINGFRVVCRFPS